MKIAPSKLKLSPKGTKYQFCVYGTPPQEINDWLSFHKLKTEFVSGYTNIFIEDVTDLFEYKTYEYCDGFSPNLNKDTLHIGHLTNLVIAKSFQKLGIAKQFNALLGDTVTGIKNIQKAVDNYLELCSDIDYLPVLHFASEQNVKHIPLYDGTNEYEGTKVFHIDDEKIVGIKSNGVSSYFYQDVAFAEKYDAQLYLTGLEQNNHFNTLKKLFPNINHVGIGLTTLNGKKMGSSIGNVISIDEVMECYREFDNKLAYNILIGNVLKYEPKSSKDVSTSNLKDVNASIGLYLSYTLARFKSTGIYYTNTRTNMLNYKHYLSIEKLAPNILLTYLHELCRDMNSLYAKYTIKNNDTNKQMFQPLFDDLVSGMQLLGFFDINKV